MNRSAKIILAIVLIIFLYILWVGLGSVVFGWKYGGGAIPTIIFIAMASYVWKTITKKEKKEKEDEKEFSKNDNINEKM